MSVARRWRAMVLSVIGAGTMLGALPAARAQPVKGDVELQRKLEDLELRGSWYYDDLQGAREEARRTGKPLFVVLRCPP